MIPRPTQMLPCNNDALDKAAEHLRAGALVAFPTETVYGLGADATNAQAVADLYQAKGRPAINPLIAHVPDLATAEREGVFDEHALKLAKAFWPGPLTLVVPVAATCSVSPLARAGLDSLGLRIPAHPIALALLKKTGRPVVAPSANRSGHVSPTVAAHVWADLEGRIDLVLDGGAAAVGVESTIIACLERPRLLRPGKISRLQVETVLGFPLDDQSRQNLLLAPGMMASHYAPHASVRLNATSCAADEVLLAFGPVPKSCASARLIYNLSERSDCDEAASCLFAALRALDATGAMTIAVMPIPFTGVGEAINDRLMRAAAPKDIGK